jgi:hypothetical protein
MAITFPSSSASPYTDPNGAVWTWTGEAWARTSGGLVQIEGPPAPTPPSLAPMARADKIADGGHLRVAMIGMSIASYQYALPWLSERIRQEYGDTPAFTITAGGLGGSFEASSQGWEKQRYGGPKFTRARGKAASSDLTISFYGDTLTLWFSRETNSEACNISIDGVTVGTTPAAGAQAYMQKQTFDGLTLGGHTLEIVKPAGAGFVYFELYEAIDSTVPGVIVHDWTLGGSSWWNTITLLGSSGAQVAGIAISGTNGVDAHCDNDDFDLYVFQHDVNDVAFAETTFLTAFERFIDVTRDHGVPVVLVSSMAGEFSNPNRLYHSGYNTIRSLYRDTALAESHVTHVDWHGATALEDIAKYAEVYYPSVSGFVLSPASHSGDFIHPGKAGETPLQHEFAKVFNLATAKAETATSLNRQVARPPRLGVSPTACDTYRLVAATVTLNGSTDTFSTTDAHGLSVGDRCLFTGGGVSGLLGWSLASPYFVHSVPTSTTFTLSESDGGAQWVTASAGTAFDVGWMVTPTTHHYLGTAEVGYAPRFMNANLDYGRTGFEETLVWVDLDAHSADGTGLSTDRLAIQSAPSGTDALGPYKTYAHLAGLTVRWGLTRNGVVAYLLVKYSGAFALRNLATKNSFLDPNGDVIPDGMIRFPTTEIGEQAVTAVIPITGDSSDSYINLIGTEYRAYDLAISAGPVWPGLYG